VEHDSLPHLREVLLFLTLAGVLVPLLQRLRVNRVVGFLTAGLLIGPHGLGSLVQTWPWLRTFTIGEGPGIDSLAQVGVVFLMFTIGLEVSAERLWSIRRWVFGAGGAQVLLCAVAIGGIAAAFGNAVPVAVVLGLALSFSSTAVVMQLLLSRREAGTPVGRAAFAVLLFQDLAVVPALILVGNLRSEDGPQIATALGLALVKALIMLAAIFWLGRRALRPLFRRIAVDRQPDTFIALTLLCTLGIAAATAAAGLSMALGAFLTGLLLAETEYRHEVEVTIEPFRGLLMGVFFLSVGMQIDVRAVVDEPLWLPLAVVGLFALKGTLTALVLRLWGLATPRAIEAGLLLGQGSEFAFILLGSALQLKVIEGATARFMLLVVALSMMFTPIAGRLAQYCRQHLERRRADAAPAGEVPELEGHVVIAGFGRVGRMLAHVLDRQRIPYLAMEVDADIVAECYANGMPVFVGNAGHPERLRRLHVKHAACVVLTMNDPQAAIEAARSARAESPGVSILARARNAQHTAQLLEAGAGLVTEETLEVGLQLAGSVLEELGMPDEVVDDLVDQERLRHRQSIAVPRRFGVGPVAERSDSAERP
jgi:CPA2 family monovalent cation:H+ antiporter-2